MKYRVQLDAVLNSDDSNAILNQVETIKADVFAPTGYTSVPIARIVKKLEVTDEIGQPTEYDVVDFDASSDTHTHQVTGLDEFNVKVDISFSVEQDYFDFLNYIESVKTNIVSGSCRFFVCRHDEVPLQKDGGYAYINLTGAQLTYPIVFE